MLIENDDRVVLDLDQALLLELIQDKIYCLPAAADEVGDFLLSQADFQFRTLLDAVNHYNTHFRLGLTDREKRDLVEYLQSLPEAD